MVASCLLLIILGLFVVVWSILIVFLVIFSSFHRIVVVLCLLLVVVRLFGVFFCVQYISVVLLHFCLDILKHLLRHSIEALSQTGPLRPLLL